MELKIAKALSALALFILSLCFGLMVPFLLWKFKAGYESPPYQSEEALSNDTEVLLADSDPTIGLNVTTRQPPGKWTSIKQYFHKQYRSFCNHDIISFINCFCGGLFLGICLLELFPESRSAVEDILRSAKIETKLPITEFLVSVGLLLVMIIEQLVSSTCARKPAVNPDVYDVMDENSEVVNSEHFSQNGNNIDQVSFQETESIVTGIEEGAHGSLASPAESSMPDASEATRSVVLITMLSIHSIFEGLALGLETTISNLIQLSIAIAVHKSVLAFGLGLKLFETFSRHRVSVAILCVLIFCAASPLGCTIGLFLEPPSGGNSTVVVPTLPTTLELSLNLTINNLSKITATMYATAILECLATGTFLYITFIEVIPSEFSHSSEHGVSHEADKNLSRNKKLPIKPIIKLIALLSGFAAVTGLQFV